jgi:phosphoglycolate phosphatase
MDEFDAVSLDWDGTLFDTRDVFLVCAKKVARDFKIDLEQFDNQNVDKNLRKTPVRLLLNSTLRPKDITKQAEWELELRRAFATSYQELEASTNLIPGATEIIHELRNSGYRLVIATSRPRHRLDPLLARFGLTRTFLTTRCSDDGPTKPNPFALISIAQQLGASIRNVVHIGDTAEDAAMSIAAGAAFRTQVIVQSHPTSI